MAVIVSVGLNQKGAAAADREIMAIAAEDLEITLAGYAALGGIDEVAALSTDQRVEIFAATRCPAATTLALRQALAARTGRDLPLVQLQGHELLRHLMRVASSLESDALGEPRIFWRVKDAFERAIDASMAGEELAGVMGRVLRAAIRVRTETAVGRAGSSCGHAAAALAGKILGPLAGRRVAIAGTGELARDAALHLGSLGAAMAILDEPLAEAEVLARDVGAEALSLSSLRAEILRSDVLVVALPAVHPALRERAMARAMRVRRRRIVLLDLAVPRAIPTGTGALSDVYLCDAGDLGRVLLAATDDREAAVAEAERIIEEELASVEQLLESHSGNAA